MTSSVVSLSTAGLPVQQRTQYWTHALTELCGHLHADPFGAEALDGHVDYKNLWCLRLCQIEVSRHRVSLPTSCAKPGAHPVIKILFQTYGTSLFEQGTRRISLTPGDCLAYDVSRPHVITSESLTKHDVVIIPKALIRKRGLAPNDMPAQKLSARAGAARLAHGFLHAAFNETDALTSDSELGVAEALLNLLLLPFSLEGTPGFDRTSPEALRWRAKTYIQDHLSDPQLDINQIATALGCTKRYLHMLFADESITISRYIWRSHLEKCHRELALCGDARPITEIAFSWGFSSSSHFSRLFKKEFGIAPSALKTRAYGWCCGSSTTKARAIAIPGARER